MSHANLTRRLLLVAGHYDCVEQIYAALQGQPFDIEVAFNHREAIYNLHHDVFGGVIVDAAMLDRHSGARTLVTIREMGLEMPLVTFILPERSERDPEALRIAREGGDSVLTSLDPPLVRRVLLDRVDTVNAGETTRSLAREITTNDLNEALTRRVSEIETLFALSRSLTEVLELNQVLNRVVEAARRLTDAEEGLILLPENDAEALVLRAKVGGDDESAHNLHLRARDAEAWQVFKTGQARILDATNPTPRAQGRDAEARHNPSLLYVPIGFKGEQIGVLGVKNWQRSRRFDVHQRELLLNLASYAAIAIENARAHEESQKRNRELEAMVRASSVLNASLSLEETLPNVCEQLAQVLNVNHTEIYRWDMDGARLMALARYQRCQWRLGEGPAAFPMDHLPQVAEAVNAGQVVWLRRDDEALLERERRYLHQRAVAALALVPVWDERGVIGLLQMAYLSPPSQMFSDLLLADLRKWARTVSQRVRQERARLLTDEAFQQLDALCQRVGACWGELGVRPVDRDYFAQVMASGSGVWVNESGPYLDLNRYPDLQSALELKDIINLHSDADTLPRGALALLQQTYAYALLALPLIYRGKLQGLVVFADTIRGRVFGERDINLGQAVVGQAATALENAHLVTDLERSLSELRRTQQKLVQTARLTAMGELAAVVAHQINNPLTTIMVDSEMLLMDEPPDSPYHEVLTSIFRAGKRAAGVARRLLAIARPADAHTPIEALDIVENVQGVLSLVQTHLERDKIRVHLNVMAEPLPLVSAARGQLDDVWLNLLLNAHDALRHQSDAQVGVDIGYVPDIDAVMVSVWDNGPGIPEGIRSEIFEPFFTTKPAGEGTGLGLYICNQVVMQVGGQMRVESQEGQGTRFVVQLPAATSVAAGASVPEGVT